MTDLTTYFPFTSGPKAAEADWGLFAQLWATDGVVRSADSEFLVQATGPASLSVDVLAGEIWAQGYFGRKGTTTNFVVTPDPTNPRIDIVVARLNFATHKIELLYRTGVAAGSPVAPTLTRVVGVTWDIALAQVTVSAAAASIVAGNITDRRPVSSGGSVTRTFTIPSAATLPVPNADQVPQGCMIVVPVSGTTGFNNITAPTAGNQILILEFSGILTVTTDTGNLRLDGGNFVTKAGAILVIEWDGTVWREISRAGGSAWNTANPTSLSQLSGVTFTTSYARLFTLKKFFHYHCMITVTSATGTSGNAVFLALPVVLDIAVSATPVGTWRLDGASGVFQTGVVCVSNGTLGIVGFLTPTKAFMGVNPAFALSIGDVLSLEISGELA